MKYCSKCKKDKPHDQFAKHKNRSDGLQAICKDCQHSIAIMYFQNNKAKFNERNKRKRVERRQFIADYLKDKQCKDCGIANPVVLTFDHVRGKKIEALANMVNRYYPLRAIMDEIAKCDIRCFNCHMIKDCQKRGGARLNLATVSPRV